MKKAIRVMRLLALAIGCFALGEPSLAQTSEETTPPPSAKEVTSTVTNMAAGPAFSQHQLTATDLEAFLEGLVPQQLTREDIVDPPVTVRRQSTIHAPAGPGIGFQANAKRLASLTVRCEEIALS